MNKKIGIAVGVAIAVIIIIIFFWKFQSNNNNNQMKNKMIANNDNGVELDVDIASTYEYEEDEGFITSTNQINLYDLDGSEKYYSFTYKDTSYKATYSEDNWHIVDSYKIRNRRDIAMICQALIEIHPIHGRDMSSYRTVEDLVYEWVQHNIAYDILPENSEWKNNVKDVDLDPADQGRNLREMYEARTGKEFSLDDIK